MGQGIQIVTRGWDEWPTSEIWVPHLRDGFMVAKVSFIYRLELARIGQTEPLAASIPEDIPEGAWPSAAHAKPPNPAG